MNWIDIKDELPTEDEVLLVWAQGFWHYAIYQRVSPSSFEFDIPMSLYIDEPTHKDVTHWARVEGKE